VLDIDTQEKFYFIDIFSKTKIAHKRSFCFSRKFTI